MALLWVSPKEASYCCSPGRHMPWSPQHCMAMGHGEGSCGTWETKTAMLWLLWEVSHQSLPDTQM